MSKRMKKGKVGDAAKYITRSQALRKLQLSLREFRRLCILKGIFPKEPKKKFKGVNKTYYLLKDIRFLATEKLLSKFREIQSYEKKIKKAKAKHEKFDAEKLKENKPTYSIDHILKERYPKFTDSLNDLDDALCLIHLFANLPKHELLNIKTETVKLCQRLSREFYLYTAVSQVFRKGFISIKGIYLNIEIMGNEITWLAPFNYPQKLSFDIDYEIMLSFLELYTGLVKFVNFKLYKDIGLNYPPPLENSEEVFFGFNSLDIKNLQDQLNKKNNSSSSITNELNFDSEELKKILRKEEEIKSYKSFFKNCVFFISRETPREILGLIISSCGGLYGDDSFNSAFSEDDPRITHYIVDRPLENIVKVKNKEYVQPQWVFDSVNTKTILPVSDYAPGKKLPSHLSPFFEYNGEEYKPTIKSNKKSQETIKPNKNNEIENEEEIENENEKPQKLNEMLISNNKKKILQRIREEREKKSKKVRKI